MTTLPNQPYLSETPLLPTEERTAKRSFYAEMIEAEHTIARNDSRRWMQDLFLLLAMLFPWSRSQPIDVDTSPRTVQSRE